MTSDHGVSILVVEDEEAQRRLIVEILERAGNVLRSAANVDEALEAIARGGARSRALRLAHAGS